MLSGGVAVDQRGKTASGNAAAADRRRRTHRREPILLGTLGTRIDADGQTGVVEEEIVRWMTLTVVVGTIGLFPVGSAAQPGPGGGLSVREAKASKLSGVLLVRGFVTIDRRGRVRLCDRLGGSPPVCQGATLVVTGVTVSRLGSLRRASGVAWSSKPQALHGRLRNGRLVFAPNVI